MPLEFQVEIRLYAQLTTRLLLWRQKRHWDSDLAIHRDLVVARHLVAGEQPLSQHLVIHRHAVAKLVEQDDDRLGGQIGVQVLQHAELSEIVGRQLVVQPGIANFYQPEPFQTGTNASRDDELVQQRPRDD